MAANPNDIIVKKNDGTTDVTFAMIVASGGDKSPAIYRANGDLPPAFSPRMTIGTKSNGNGKSRILESEFRYPVTATVSGVTTQIDLPRATLVMHLPQAVPQAITDEFVSQALNAFSSQAMRLAAKTGYAQA